MSLISAVGVYAEKFALSSLVAAVAALGISAGGVASEAQPPNTDDPHELLAFEILRDAIPRETVKGAGNVPAFAAHVRDIFLEGGFAPEDVELVPYGETTSLLVRYRGDGSSGRQPILFSSHFDVVPADPADWVRNPYELQEDDTFYFGRGVLDNKFDIAILTASFVRLKSEGFVPNRDLIIAFTGDEETQQATARMLTEQHREKIAAEYAFIVDGGGGQLDDAGNGYQFLVGVAEKTYATFTVIARNPGGHSSLPREDNAIFDLADAIKAIQHHRFAVQNSELTRTYFARTAPLLEGDIGEAMTRFVADPDDQEAIETIRARPEYVGTLGTTCVPTMLKAGHAENALPQSAVATVNCRIFPGISVSETLNELKMVVDNSALEWQVLDNPTSSDASPLNLEVFEAVEASLEPMYPGVPVIPQMLSGATDGVFFRAAGIPSYSLTGIFLNPADDFAHGLNERVPRKALPESMAFWHSMILRLAGK